MSQRIGLIADTHLKSPDESLPVEVFRALEGVDLILHGGDIYVPEALRQLERIAPVYAAQGNGDVHYDRHPEDCFGADGILIVKKHRLFELERVSIGLMHIFPIPEDEPYVDLEWLMQHAFGARPQVVVCGDTHVDKIVEHAGVLIVDPGSPTLPRQMRLLGTVGVLTVDDGEYRAEILPLQRFS